jgi:phosphoglycerate kinase
LHWRRSVIWDDKNDTWKRSSIGNFEIRLRRNRQQGKIPQQLAPLAGTYANDAFGSAHKAHASTEKITQFLKQSVAGFPMEKELEFLRTNNAEAKHPFVVIRGEAQVSDKIKGIDNLLEKPDFTLVIGAVASNFLAGHGNTTGNSTVKMDKIQVAKDAIQNMKER